ncbi:MAG TPA: hypothetical protein VKZ86_16025 [Cyclobacteriaceae bacterium]|nr:hypothetical protein [Cyclobacteriaceae bacterium]
MARIASILLMAGTLVLACACATYYHTQADFNREFERGDLDRALQALQRRDQGEQGRNKFLYLVNNGLVLSVMGKYRESNEYFEKAYLFGEDYHKNYINEVASYWTNPMVTVYRGEDHEHLMVLYYKALNFLKMERYEQALVECRRLNLRLQELSDKYRSPEKYRRDAFVHTLMGIIYQAMKDYNNAFIAYRNALEIYDDDYTRLFSLEAPQQLRYDLLNTAWWTGLYEEYDFYRERFGLEDYAPPRPDAELVFFWHNGLSPVKEEWSINFAIHTRHGNQVVFINEGMGLDFAFTLDDDDDRSRLSGLNLYRVAFPRYRERPVFYRGAHIRMEGQEYPLEAAQDLNGIAIHSLRERMMLEFSKGLLRAALKKATEMSVRKEDATLGALIGVVNALTEHADTRNWQTLPHTISYARIPLREGDNAVEFVLYEPGGRDYTHHFTYRATRHQTLFHTFSSLESMDSPYKPAW